jgi:hypothetical protein
MKNDQMDDEAELKKRGLASADKVGFFERIRMGNIDDPQSEAYKRFGAGRGRSEAAKTKASTVDQIGDRERREDAMASLLKNKPTKSAASPTKAVPTKTTAKPAIVTKEQMKKKGFDNLRDYLNAERNLKRRDNFASEAQKRLFATGARGTQTEGSAGEAEARAALSSMRGEYGTMKKGGKVESKLMGKEGRGMAKATMQKVASKAVKGHESRMHKMKSGGTVSSASKRADGIAKTGKTKGRVV